MIKDVKATLAWVIGNLSKVSCGWKRVHTIQDIGNGVQSMNCVMGNEASNLCHKGLAG